MAKFKVLLVYPNLQMVNLLPSNMAILSACLKKAGMEVRLFDTTLYKTAEKSVDEIRVEHMQVRPFNLKQKGVDYKTTDAFVDFEELVAEYKPDVIGVTATDDTYDLGLGLISRVRDRGIHVTFGGVRPTFSPEEVIACEYVDSICIGDGEEAFVELCVRKRDGGKITDIENLWVKEGGRVFKNRIRPPVDIESLPYDDFSIFEEERFYRPMQGKVYRMVPICIDRGCPYGCAFCAAPSKQELYTRAGHRGYFRLKSTKRVLAELKFYIGEYKADYIYFNSETFFARPEKDIEEFASEYSANIGLPFWCQTRIETITERRAGLLKRMGCDRISIGLEHGNEKFRKKILKKNFTNEQVISAFKILRKAGIPVTVNNIVGFPDETRDLVFDTIRLNREITADSINAYFFVPYRGTPLREYCLQKGYVAPDTRTDSLMRSSILGMPQFSRDEIKGLVRTFPLYVKLPESFFDKIRIAERPDAEGQKMLTELKGIYFSKYFS
jgi:anaerobic magnesium-protoporphyrin IX monomethyl ester cyclase